MSQTFSLSSVLDFLDSQPEPVVMSLVAQAYQDNHNRGIFSEKFIPWIDVQTLGYAGFRAILVSLFEIDPEFMEQHRFELFTIVRKLKGEY